ncbi:class I SAM-dependent methyltransferase [Enterococcus asini]|uniref:class I SAM-dependent methyltransferase n=1 Tax=Enterococcus asini TaxID=57732 RepID=UPI00288D5D43|nr:class I SAM-dependent methyltransferase [Enterococcus asini]MDT2757077.1 class I SAM-dependent methyltransferase [Enterococcus asini]
MTNHYYSEKPELAHDFVEWDFELKGNRFHFVTDSGVFSRNTVDYGSRVLVEAFEETNLPAGPILDVGCGYGPIGLSLQKATGRLVEMIDINQRAVELAQRNAERNQITQVKIHQSNIYQDLQAAPYAAIVSNPPIRAGKTVVHEILTGAFDHLLAEGSLTVVIQKKQGAPSAKKKMMEVFGNCETVSKDKGYYILRSVKN